jgi:mannosyl-3-phosphoglycerate phosphatase
MIKVVFSDLDGTLLDSNFSAKAAASALELVKSKGTPLIFCTSKTFEETLEYEKEFNIKHPFIVESGGAIHIPTGYFSFKYQFEYTVNGYDTIQLGANPSQLAEALAEIKANIPVKILSELTAEEIANLTGLPVEKAELVKTHKFEYNLILARADEEKARAIVEKKGLNLTKGKFYFLKKGDKGKAVRKLTELYERQYGQVKTFAVGDALNDEPMLKAVDEAYVVKNVEGKHFTDKYNLLNGIGPEGWTEFIQKILKDKK